MTTKHGLELSLEDESGTTVYLKVYWEGGSRETRVAFTTEDGFEYLRGLTNAQFGALYECVHTRWTGAPWDVKDANIRRF